MSYVNANIDLVGDILTHENFVGNNLMYLPDSISLKERKIDVRDVFRRWPESISITR